MNTNLEQSLALQILYLFEVNELPLLLPEASRLSDTEYLKASVLFEKLVAAAKKNKLIPTRATVTDFLTEIRDGFTKAREKRTELLKEKGYPPNFEFPYNHEEFPLSGDFIVNPVVVKRRQSKLKDLVDDNPGNGIRLIGAEVNHDNSEMYYRADSSTDPDPAQDLEN